MPQVLASSEETPVHELRSACKERGIQGDGCAAFDALAAARAFEIADAFLAERAKGRA
jgi:hypothetical protein